jgi:hypothetical protein
MKNRFTLILLAIALFCAKLNAQQQVTTLLFDYKKSALTEEHNGQLKQIFESFNPDSVSIKIDSYCDSVGGPDYNIGLGEDRGNSVTKFFTSKKVKKESITIVNHGSDQPQASNSTEDGRRLNRRVAVVIMSTKVGAVAPAPKINMDSLLAAQERLRCAGDTIINLPNGVIMKMGKCEFEKIERCMTISVYNTGVMLRKSGYSTMGPAFSNLEAIAIVDVKLCADTNLTKAMKIYIPIASSCANTKPVDVWKGYSKMIWQNRGEAAKKESLNGKDYYVLETKTSVAANFASDVDATQNPVFQFKAKKGLKITEIRVSYDCGMGVYIKTTPKPSKKVKMALPCPKGDVYVEVYAVDKSGKTVRMDYTSSGKIKTKSKQKACKAGSVGKKYYLFPDTFAN